MLAYDTKRRATALDCLKHSWILHEIDSTYDPKRRSNSNNGDSSRSNQNATNERNNDKDLMLKSEYNVEKNAEPKSSHFHTDLKSKKYLDLVKKINETEDSTNDVINFEKYKSQIDESNEENSS